MHYQPFANIWKRNVVKLKSTDFLKNAFRLNICSDLKVLPHMQFHTLIIAFKNKQVNSYLTATFVIFKNRHIQHFFELILCHKDDQILL